MGLRKKSENERNTAMNGPRDSQRSKVYKSEKVISKHLLPCKQPPTLDDVQTYLDKVTRSRFFKSLWMEARGDVEIGGPAKLRMKDGRGTSWARGGFIGYHRDRCPTCGHGRYGVRIPIISLNLPLWSRKPSTLLHELAHGVSRPDPAHGREFAAVWLKLVTRFMGKESGDALRAEYRRLKVKHQRTRKRGPVSPERRAQLVAQLAAAREKKDRR